MADPRGSMRDTVITNAGGANVDAANVDEQLTEVELDQLLLPGQVLDIYQCEKCWVVGDGCCVSCPQHKPASALRAQTPLTPPSSNRY